MSTVLPIVDPNQDAQPGTMKFHLSLNVSDLSRSVAFYRLLLGAEPAKLRDDYAKFELDSPPLVLSLEPPGGAGRGGWLNHVGFRMPSSAELVASQARLEAGGLRTQREEGVECCYARQTKFWIQDPDGVLWEMYTFEGDIEHRGAGQDLDRMLPDSSSATATAAAAPVATPAEKAAAQWAHRLGQPWPTKIFVHDGSVDEVQLQGTFNAADAPDMTAALTEVHRALRPGGRLAMHVLTAHRPLPAGMQLALPGPAAVVQRVPTLGQLTSALEASGFCRITFEKLGETPCFTIDGIEMRETKLSAIRAE